MTNDNLYLGKYSLTCGSTYSYLLFLTYSKYSYMVTTLLYR